MGSPLADRIRPQSLDDIVGQRHLLAPGKALRRIIESGEIPNMVFYGPPGVGKTTLAALIARQTKRKLCKLNGTTASTADPAGISGKRKHHPHCLYHGKSLLLCVQRHSEPFHGV